MGDVMLSERLLDIRDEAELNQEDMAEILKVSQSNYSRWENGKELIPLSKLNILCSKYGLCHRNFTKFQMREKVYI